MCDRNQQSSVGVDGARVGLAQAAMSAGSSLKEDRQLNSSFETALRALKQGNRVQRAGWNGLGQYAYMVEGSDNILPHERAQLLSGIPQQLFQLGDRGTARRMPRFELCTSEGHTAAWVPSTTDLLAHDWRVL